jgi:hypothetical protein
VVPTRGEGRGRGREEEGERKRERGQRQMTEAELEFDLQRHIASESLTMIKSMQKHGVAGPSDFHPGCKVEVRKNFRWNGLIVTPLNSTDQL